MSEKCLENCPHQERFYRGKLQLEKEIEQLKAQINKMRNSWNCGSINRYCYADSCPCEKWKLKEVAG